MAVLLKVAQSSSNLSSKEIRRTFEKYGKVLSVKERRGCYYVEMEDNDAARTAVTNVGLGERKLQVRSSSDLASQFRVPDRVLAVFLEPPVLSAVSSRGFPFQAPI